MKPRLPAVTALVSLATAVVVLSNHIGVEGLVNDTCPLASSSPSGDTQQIITPFQWNDSDWYLELGTIVNLLADFVPGGVSALCVCMYCNEYFAILKWRCATTRMQYPNEPPPMTFLT